MKTSLLTSSTRVRITSKGHLYYSKEEGAYLIARLEWEGLVWQHPDGRRAKVELTDVVDMVRDRPKRKPDHRTHLSLPVTALSGSPPGWPTSVAASRRSRRRSHWTGGLMKSWVFLTVGTG